MWNGNEIEAKVAQQSFPSGTPEYYKFFVRGVAVQPFDIIEGLDLNFNLGNAMKYLCRCGRKGKKAEDLLKAKACIERELARLGATQPAPPPPAPYSSWGASTGVFVTTPNVRDTDRG